MATPRSHSANTKLKLRLYVAGRAPNSLRAIGNSKAICEEHFSGRYELEIIDMIAHPKRAIADGIVVTPTLLRLAPEPVIRVIGNLSDTDKVLTVLAGQ